MSAPSLSERTVAAGQWRMAAWGVQAALQLGFGVVLARLLPPSDFGVAALAWVVVSFATLFSQLGLGVAVVQRRPLGERHVRAAFTASLAAGAAAAALLWALAPFSAGLLRTPELPGVLRALTPVFVLGGLGATARALLQRRLDFRALFVVDVASYAAGYGGVALGLALAGHGVWSLVWGTVAQALLACGLELALARHPLRPLLAGAELRELCGFGAGASLNQLVNHVARNADNLLVGRLLGAAALGLYSRAFNLMALPLAAVGDAMWQVLFPAMAEVRGDRERLGRAYLAAVEASALAAAPLMAGIAASAPHLAAGVYGPAWAEMATPLRLLCAAGLFRAVYHVSGALTHASGRVYSELWRQAAYAALVVGGAVLGARWGVGGVAAALAAAIGCMYLAMARLSLAIVGRGWRDFFAAQLPGVALGALTGAAVLAVSRLLEAAGAGHLAIFAADVAAGGVALVAGVALLPPPLRPAELFGRLEGSVRRLPGTLRLPVARVLRLSGVRS